ncbi:hypothetical protein [uncultured Dysosmobacter sp.]|uniref:hypothetical protein n=1 Tax=uncultured Dysosmobacter sp. TaxID=2591384 RepID=UPI0026253A69|nr:hypothetical protein [uncultured Dysosmobacter sp.]
MTNTERYFRNIEWFRKDLREIDARYKPKYDHISQFKDSEYYPSEKASLDKQRAAEVDALRREALTRIHAVVDDMERTYMERPSSAPTQEQLALLTALKMRETVSRDELREAANALKGCPVGERVLEEIARKNSHAMTISTEISGDEVRKHIQSLRNSAEHMILRLEHTDSRRVHTNSGDYSLFRLDVDPANEADALRIFGYVTDTKQFANAVNAEVEV